MADFGIINLQAEGDITSYDPPEALVYEFGTFHDEINDKIVSVMSLLPNSTARPSIDKLRRTIPLGRHWSSEVERIGRPTGENEGMARGAVETALGAGIA